MRNYTNELWMTLEEFEDHLEETMTAQKIEMERLKFSNES